MAVWWWAAQSFFPLLLASFPSVLGGAPHPLSNHRYQASTKRCHHPPSLPTVPSITHRYVHAPIVITHRNKQTKNTLKKRKPGNKKRTNKRTMPLPYGRGRHLYNCQSLCVYLTHSHLSAARARHPCHCKRPQLPWPSWRCQCRLPRGGKGWGRKEWPTTLCWHHCGPLARSLAAQVTELHTNPKGAGQTFLKLC